jgi:hypothetical protein
VKRISSELCDCSAQRDDQSQKNASLRQRDKMKQNIELTWMKKMSIDLHPSLNHQKQLVADKKLVLDKKYNAHQCDYQ